MPKVQVDSIPTNAFAPHSTDSYGHVRTASNGWQGAASAAGGAGGMRRFWPQLRILQGRATLPMVACCLVAGGGLVASSSGRGGCFPNAFVLAPEGRPCPSTSVRDGRPDLESGSHEWSSRVRVDSVVNLGPAVPAMAVTGPLSGLPCTRSDSHSHPPARPPPTSFPVFPWGPCSLLRSSRFRRGGSSVEGFTWWVRVFEPELLLEFELGPRVDP